MGNQRSKSRKSAASDATPDFSANHSTPIPTVDAKRPLEAYHHPWQARPSSHTGCSERAVGSNSYKRIPRAKPIKTFNANAAVQTVGAKVGGNVIAQNATFIANAPSSLASQTSKKSTFRLNIPTPTQHYKGRQDTLGELQEFYDQLPQKSSDCWERIAAIVGLGGMGKTETASKYANQHRKAFPNAAWINAETDQGMLNSFLDLAKHLKLVEKDQNSADLNLVKQVYRYIDQEYDSNVLFIFDNAIALTSDGAEVGILEFLPIDDLPNQRFPNILITTQTPEWGRRIRTVQVEELSEEEALEFFASCFKVKPSECTEEFKMLNDLLDGYPLCMNLAVSSIDFVSSKHSVDHLKQQIKEYIDKVQKEEERLTSEKIKPAWGHKYNRTLSTVWKLTQERIEKEEDGPEALEILQIMSYLRLPFKYNDVVRILQLNTDCPHLEKEDIKFRLKKLFRVLEKLYLVPIVFDEDSRYAYVYDWDVEIHRLVQLVVRQQTNCNQALETLLRFVEIYKIYGDYKNCDCVNLSALEEALKNPRIQFTSRSLSYVAALALEGNNSARTFFETRTPETEADATFWRLCSLLTNITTSDVIAHQVIRELVGLTKTSDWLLDRRFIAEMTLALAYADSEKGPCYYYRIVYRHSLMSHLDSLDDIVDLTVELILNICSFQDLTCESVCPNFVDLVIELIEYLVKGFLQVDGLKQKSVPVERLAATWLAFLSKLRDCESLSEWRRFWLPIYKIFDSPEASSLRIAELRTCLWDRGLADELIQAFKSVKVDDWAWLLAFPECIDVCLDGMDLLDVRCQQVISVFTEETTNYYLDPPSSSGRPLSFLCKTNWVETNLRVRHVLHSFTVATPLFSIICEVCLVWINLLLMDRDPTSESILECLSRCEALNWFEGIREDSIRDIQGHIADNFLKWHPLYKKKYHSKYFGEFIRRYSSSQVRHIQALRTFCEIALAIPLKKYLGSRAALKFAKQGQSR